MKRTATVLVGAALIGGILFRAASAGHQRAAVALAGRRYVAAVQLVRALGGGWDAGGG